MLHHTLPYSPAFRCKTSMAFELEEPLMKRLTSLQFAFECTYARQRNTRFDQISVTRASKRELPLLISRYLWCIITSIHPERRCWTSLEKMSNISMPTTVASMSVGHCSPISTNHWACRSIECSVVVVESKRSASQQWAPPLVKCWLVGNSRLVASLAVVAV